ncbi:MAG: hypothetical protein GY749_44110 [Desulfobacteraceae bacterium]|nr:hypothetical protein [Desulfobacteraceae bacterium]
MKSNISGQWLSDRTLTAINLILIASLFFYYCWFILYKLSPVIYPDTFSYLWEIPVNFYYWTGRSLTQRIIFSLCLKNPHVISIIHLITYALTALTLYLLLSRQGRKIYNFFLCVFICFVFSSYTLNVTAVAVTACPIYHSLAILFPCVLFLTSEKTEIATVSVVGILFVFSKNTVPFIIILLLLLRLISGWKTIQYKMAGVYAMLAFSAVLKIGMIYYYDTSTKLNLLTIYTNRIIPDKDAAALFNKKYGLPLKAFAERSEYVVKGRINPVTRNYELVRDPHGIVDWIKSQGGSAYIRYLFFDNFCKTYSTFKKEYHEFYIGDTINIYTKYYLMTHPSAKRTNNPAMLPASGFSGFDSLEILKILPAESVLPILRSFSFISWPD